jgi:hypothetical protein
LFVAGVCCGDEAQDAKPENGAPAKAPALPATVKVYATVFDNDGKEFRGPEVDVVVN